MTVADAGPAEQSGRVLEVLLLVDRIENNAANIDHHIDGLIANSRHRMVPLRMLGELPNGLDLARFDVVIVHWSLAATLQRNVGPAARRRLREASAVKAIFIQDEYRRVDDHIALFREMGIDVLFTTVPAGEVHKVYPEDVLPGVGKLSVITGYVDAELVQRPVPPLRDRPIDVGYRARQLQPQLGQLGQEKALIGQRFARDAPRYGLQVDISHRIEDRLYGEDWIEFLLRCRATLGVESGASVFDFDGSIEAAVTADLLDDPTLSFEELQRRHFAHLEGRIRHNQISPRIFEAAALRTLMINYEGDYSGRLTPWEHYVPLRRDHSNMDEVVAVLRDPERAQEIVDRAYREVALNPRNGMEWFVAEVDAALTAAAEARAPASGPSYDARELDAMAARDRRLRLKLGLRRLRAGAYRFAFGSVLGRLGPERRDAVERWLRRRRGLVQRRLRWLRRAS